MSKMNRYVAENITVCFKNYLHRQTVGNVKLQKSPAANGSWAAPARGAARGGPCLRHAAGCAPELCPRARWAVPPINSSSLTHPSKSAPTCYKVKSKTFAEDIFASFKMQN